MTASADGSPTPFPAREPDEQIQPAAVPDPPSPTDPPSPSSAGPDPASLPTEVHPTLATTSSDTCPSCGKPLAADQRYCLECGHRRGDPRLPFMDAVVFMEAINRPQTPPPPPPPSGTKSKGLSANASLIAGIATLVLAIGVGVLIGQSGDNGTSNAASQAPVIIRSGSGESSGEGEEEATAEASAGKKNGGKSKGGEKKANNAAAKKAEAKSETGSSGTSKAVEEVLEPKVPQAKPEATVGESCDKGTAGCSDNGKFEGEFFGE
ncbi:MAG TPA: zinc ribbon domain-containing protein [Solirubrobacterales bacterium]|nr:zinc ribbon domain-containing protein [Solirubrobacterales bacterium]